jgi:molecular chaperone HscC
LLTPVPPRRAGAIEVRCRFSYDASGLLEVDLTVPETGMTKQLVIVDDEAEDEAKLAKRRSDLARIKLHPREESGNAALFERVKRCYESQLGDTRLYVAQLMSQLEAGLDSQDPRIVAKVRDEVGQAIDALEGERFL